MMDDAGLTCESWRPMQVEIILVMPFILKTNPGCGSLSSSLVADRHLNKKQTKNKIAFVGIIVTVYFFRTTFSTKSKTHKQKAI